MGQAIYGATVGMDETTVSRDERERTNSKGSVVDGRRRTGESVETAREGKTRHEDGTRAV